MKFRKHNFFQYSADWPKNIRVLQRKGDRAHSDLIVTPSLHDLPVSPYEDYEKKNVKKQN